MARLAYFQQDPQAPPGAGWFHSDSGQQVYEHLPEVASQLPPPPDMRMAMNDSADAGAGDASMAGGAPPQVAPSVPDVGPQMAPGAPPIAAPGVAAPPPSPQAQTAPPEADPDDQLRAEQQAYVNRPVYSAPVKGGFRPKSAEVTTEGAEAPMEQADWQELSRMNHSIIQAKTAEAGLVAGRAMQQQAQAEAALPGLMAERDRRQAEYEARQAAAKHDLAQIGQLVQATNAKQIDPERWFKSKGAIGNIVAGIAQALGGYGGQHNAAADIINGYVDRDIAAQRADVENGRAGANNMLQMLKLKYDFDLPQAESALKLIQNSIVQQQLKAWEGTQLSQDASAKLEAWTADQEKANFMEARKLMTASMGKQTRKESLAYQQGSAGGMRAPTHAERMGRLGEIDESQKTGTMLKPGAGDKPIERSKVVYGLDGKPVEARTEQEATKIREQYKLFKQAIPSLDKLEQSAGILNSLSPDQQAQFGIHFENMLNTVNTMAGQGVVRTDDIDRWHGYLKQGGFGAKKAIQELREMAKNAYQASVDSQTGAEVNENYKRGKPGASYSGRAATTPTVGRTNSSNPTEDMLREELEKYK